MLPRKYYPPLQNNVAEQRAQEIAQQLHGDDMVLDFDQLVAKRPHRTDAVFAWHQDQQYWPTTEDTRTATVWFAIDDSTVANGCMRFVPGSHREAELRPHAPVFGDRGKSHALATELHATDKVQEVPIMSGDCTVHNERVLHGSGGNHTDGLRRALVLAYRSDSTVKSERELGFSHSHNDAPEVLSRVGDGN
jgi:phytanoyl-CoA hydroxylase